MSRWDFRSVDADEVQEFVAGVYSENEFKIIGQTGASRTRIYGGDLGDIAQFNVSHSSPFTFLSKGDREIGSHSFLHSGNGQFSSWRGEYRVSSRMRGPDLVDR